MKKIKRTDLSFNGKWFECAPSNESTALSTVELTVWINILDPQTAMNVWHRYRLVGSRYKNMANWMKNSFFFKNAKPQQLIDIVAKVDQLLF